MRWYRIALLASMAATAFVACSLDEGGFGSAIENPDGSITPDGSIPDAKIDGASDAGSDANPNACPGGDYGKCTALKLPAGWVPIGYRDDGSSCPEGFETLPRVTQPSGGSCGCNAADFEVNGTKCRVNELRNLRWNNNGTEVCDDTVANPNIVFPDGGCYNFNNPRPMRHFQATPLATAASCTTAGFQNDAGISAKPLKICTSQIAACNGVLCANPKVCIMHPGQVDCPDDEDYGDPRRVGTGVDLQCGRCANGTYSATCTGTAQLFTNSTCSGTPDSVAIDSTCNATQPGGGPAGNYDSLRYTANEPTDGRCTPGAAPQAKPKLTDVATVCCRD